MIIYEKRYISTTKKRDIYIQNISIQCIPTASQGFGQENPLRQTKKTYFETMERLPYLGLENIVISFVRV